MATPPRKVSLLWPDATDGPWVVDVWWRVQFGTAVPVGIALRSWVTDTAPESEQVLEQVYDAEFRGRTTERLPSATDDVEFERLSSTVIRSLPLSHLMESARSELADRFDFSGLTERDEWSETLRSAVTEWETQYSPEREALKKPRGGRDLGDDHYREVARIYREAANDGGNPTAAVAEHFTVSKSAAAKKVARARDRHFLPTTSRGRVGRLTEDL